MGRVADGGENSSTAVRAPAALFHMVEVALPTSTIGGYNPVSRFVEALAADPEPVHA